MEELKFAVKPQSSSALDEACEDKEVLPEEFEEDFDELSLKQMEIPDECSLKEKSDKTPFNLMTEGNTAASASQMKQTAPASMLDYLQASPFSVFVN